MSVGWYSVRFRTKSAVNTPKELGIVPTVACTRRSIGKVAYMSDFWVRFLGGMKGEFAFVLGIQSQLDSPLGRTRSQFLDVLGHGNGGPENGDVSNKLLKVSSVIVYSGRDTPGNGIS